jgi:cell division protein ZapA (FtsZ GTPase activity inhibitor)
MTQDGQVDKSEAGKSKSAQPSNGLAGSAGPRSAKPDSAYVTVHIYDQTYHLSGSSGSESVREHVQGLAARVDSRMRAVAAVGRTADSLRVAVLAALNLADELARAEERLRKLEGTLDVACRRALPRSRKRTQTSD